MVRLSDVIYIYMSDDVSKWVFWPPTDRCVALLGPLPLISTKYHTSQTPNINIATGRMSQAITYFHLFGSYQLEHKCMDKYTQIRIHGYKYTNTNSQSWSWPSQQLLLSLCILITPTATFPTLLPTSLVTSFHASFTSPSTCKSSTIYMTIINSPATSTRHQPQIQPPATYNKTIPRSEQPVSGITLSAIS